MGEKTTEVDSSQEQNNSNSGPPSPVDEEGEYVTKIYKSNPASGIKQKNLKTTIIRKD